MAAAEQCRGIAARCHGLRRRPRQPAQAALAVGLPVPVGRQIGQRLPAPIGFAEHAFHAAGQCIEGRGRAQRVFAQVVHRIAPGAAAQLVGELVQRAAQLPALAPQCRASATAAPVPARPAGPSVPARDRRGAGRAAGARRAAMRWPAGSGPARHAARRRVPKARAAACAAWPRCRRRRPAPAPRSPRAAVGTAAQPGGASTSSSVGPSCAGASAWPRCSAASVCSTRCAETASAAAVSSDWLPGVRYSSRPAMAAISRPAHSGSSQRSGPPCSRGVVCAQGSTLAWPAASARRRLCDPNERCFWSGPSCAGLVMPCGPAAAGTRTARGGERECRDFRAAGGLGLNPMCGARASSACRAARRPVCGSGLAQACNTPLRVWRSARPAAE